MSFKFGFKSALGANLNLGLTWMQIGALNWDSVDRMIDRPTAMRWKEYGTVSAKTSMGRDLGDDEHSIFTVLFA